MLCRLLGHKLERLGISLKEVVDINTRERTYSYREYVKCKRCDYGCGRNHEFLGQERRKELGIRYGR